MRHKQKFDENARFGVEHGGSRPELKHADFTNLELL